VSSKQKISLVHLSGYTSKESDDSDDDEEDDIEVELDSWKQSNDETKRILAQLAASNKIMYDKVSSFKDHFNDLIFDENSIQGMEYTLSKASDQSQIVFNDEQNSHDATSISVSSSKKLSASNLQIRNEERRSKCQVVLQEK
jgi:hypothetical protein